MLFPGLPVDVIAGAAPNIPHDVVIGLTCWLNGFSYGTALESPSLSGSLGRIASEVGAEARLRAVGVVQAFLEATPPSPLKNSGELLQRSD